MGRIRTIKPEFFLDDELYDLELETGYPIRVAFAGLWCQCDREGRFGWNPRKLKIQVLPYDDLDFSRVLDALATREFLVKYKHEGQEYGYIPGFLRHQVVNNKEKASILPEPNETNTLTRNERVLDAIVTRDVRKGREGKGKEQVKKKNIKKKSAAFVPPSVEQVKAYVVERNSTIDPEQFVDHYTGNGWMRGKNKIKDWKACVRVWEKNEKGFNQPAQAQRQEIPLL